LPTDKEEVLNVAWPAALSVPDPIDVAPSKNVTVPVGVAEPEAGVTVAVKVTDCPKTEGFCEDTTVVVVFTMLELATEKLAMPVAQLPAPLLLMNSFSAQNVVVLLGSIPMPL
jgi:hypothetical protein